MVTLSYRRSFSRSVETKVSHTYWTSAIHAMLFSQELLQCVLAKPSMQYRSPINLKSNHRRIPHSARIAHTSTHLGMTITLLICLQRLFEERTLASQVSFQQEKPIHCSNGQPIKRYSWLAWKEGEESLPHRSPHRGTIM